MFLLGQKIGKYEVRRHIGRGTFGAVYLVQDALVGALRAIKIPHDQSAEGREALLEECRILARLDHPNIVRLLTCDEHEGNLFVAMEWVDGSSLSRRIGLEGPLPTALALGIVIQVCAGLGHAHEQEVLHGDLNSANVLLSGETAKISDFGLARGVTVAEEDPGPIGNPLYMAPEQLAGRACLGSDIYSAGVVLFEALTGGFPYEDPNPERLRERILEGGETSARKRNPRVPEDVDAVVARALAPAVSERYAAIEELGSDLKALLSMGADASDWATVRGRIRSGDPVRPQPCWRCRRPLHPFAPACAHCGAARHGAATGVR